MRSVRAVIVFAERPAEMARWYAEALGWGAVDLMPGGAAIVDVGAVELVFHPADGVKNPQGASTVVYWQSADMGSDLDRLVGLGASVHRGPLVVADGRSICQLLDPWGNVFGVDG
jgi:predicted enzyme related to lactoylglutathione lyase